MRSKTRTLVKGGGLKKNISVFAILLMAALCWSIQATNAMIFKTAVIRLGETAQSVEENVAGLLMARLSEGGAVSVRLEREGKASVPRADELLVLLGIPEHHTQIRAQLDLLRIAPLTFLDPGVEGFLLQRLEDKASVTLLAAGCDERGVLYVAGELLRRLDIRKNGVEVPDSLEIRTAPAFEVRGTQVGQSGVAREKAEVRPWTEKEMQRAILDYALAGLNTIQIVGSAAAKDDPTYRFLKSFGLKTLLPYTPNAGSGPIAWQAAESIGRTGYLCPSIPEARAALLKKCEDTFRKSAPFDYVRLAGGDGGGCECDRCKPFGKTFILLCEEMARIIHKYHPDTQIFITNQKFDNNDDGAIFQYLQEKARPWLRAFCYGPGSDAMSWQPGHRQNHRLDLFRYPGFGPFDRYLKEILHQLPPQQDIVFYNELTHWRYSQYGYIQMYPRADREGQQPPPWNHFIYERRPDQYLTMVYDRLTFFAWPHYYHWVFNQTLRYGIGDCTHSSGTQDHFNQWMWQRLLWAPQKSVEAVVDEYSRAWFGPEAAAAMASAIFQLEHNLQEDPSRPLGKKEGIDTYHRLVKEAGVRMPAMHMRGNWLWREFMQKAVLDKYVQLRVQQQLSVQQRIEQHISKALTNGGIDTAITKAVSWLDLVKETEEMRSLREEAGRLGEESNTLFGVRSEGYFNLQHDFIGLGWLRRQLERAKTTAEDKKRELLGMVTDYENPGEGGFYDNCGTHNRAPHVVFGYPYDHGQPYVSPMLAEGNRPSQRSMHYTQDEERGVTFHYTGLDMHTAYRVRLTLVRPWYPERYATRMNQKAQSIYADEFLLAKDVELPLQMSDFFSYDIPEAATRDGVLTIRLQIAAEVAQGPRIEREVWRNTGGWGTLVSEIWLMKRRKDSK